MIEKIRLDRLLSNLGLCTRSKVLSYIGVNRVTVLGQKVSPKTKVNVDDVRIMGKKLENTNPLTIAVHKPNGYICSTIRDGDHKIIYDLLPPDFAKRIPTLSVAGRLDKWVTGLVLMSQDGKIVERIITPKDDYVGKVYDIVCKAPFKGNEEEAFQSGSLMLRSETEPCKPAKFEVLDLEKNSARITLFEGRYHQVRRMMAALDNKAIEIHRTRVGPIELGDLPSGKWRYLTEEEMEAIKKIQVTKSLRSKNKYNKKKLNAQSTGEDEHDDDEQDDDGKEEDDDFEEEDEFDEYEDFEDDKDIIKKQNEFDYQRKLESLILEEQKQQGLVVGLDQNQQQQQGEQQTEQEEQKEEIPAILEDGRDPRDLITNEQIQEEIRKAIMSNRKNVRFNKRGEVMGLREVDDDDVSESDAIRMIEEDEEYQEYLKEGDDEDDDDIFGMGEKRQKNREDDDDDMLLSGLEESERSKIKSILPGEKKKKSLKKRSNNNKTTSSSSSNNDNFKREIKRKQLREKLSSRRNK